MGSTNSHLQHQQQPMLMDHQMPPAIMHQPHESTYQPQYPDMNQIFKGIPKMMQVADDMHRMTNYMQDLRNMMAICSFITTVALIIFLVIRVLQNRKITKRRRRTNNNQRTDESEQSSLSISRPSNYRHYHSARPVNNWTHKIEMDRMIAYGPPDSTSTRQTNLMSAQGTPGATANAAGGPIHHGSHGLLLNNRTALTATPEHHPHHPQQHHSHSHHQSHHQNPHQQYNNVSLLHESQSGPPGAGGNVNNGSTNGNNSPCPTPTSSGHPTSIIMPIQNAPSQQPNGQLKPFKRLDPVKLVVDEMPYMEDNSENDEQH